MAAGKSPILKLALFATGLSGIVAEYILSTLATYFLGDSAVQWSLIVSVMLFSMGLGSRLSKYLDGNLLVTFIWVEFALSILVSFSSLFAYTVAGFSDYDGFFIYTLSIAIGTLIGLEIPLVIRLNEKFESLKVNVASVMEKDYLGSLVGGLFFAFVGLPYLGLTYTPFVLGCINLIVALVLLYTVRKEVPAQTRGWITASGGLITIVIVAGLFLAQPIILFGEQARYKDKIVYAKQSRYQRIVMTQWKDHYWLFLNGNQQLSTLDEDKYHEPLVHPIMQLAKQKKDVLVLGGGDGCAVREILKYQEVQHITLIDLDSVMTNLGRQHPILTDLNKNALNHEKVRIINTDGFNYLEKTRDFYDVIIVDLPDPRSVELNRLYTEEFYSLCYRSLRPQGMMITQAGSPYYATRAFLCINRTMAAAGFETAKLHNQVITLGEWGWILGTRPTPDRTALKERLQQLHFENVETQWINHEAMQLMTSFGKNIYIPTDTAAINRIQHPVLYRYYLNGNWDLY